MIKWKCSALLLSWLALGVALTKINQATQHLDRIMFLTIFIASVSYLIGTIALLKPLTKNPK